MVEGASQLKQTSLKGIGSSPSAVRWLLIEPIFLCQLLESLGVFLPVRLHIFPLVALHEELTYLLRAAHLVEHGVALGTLGEHVVVGIEAVKLL